MAISALSLMDNIYASFKPKEAKESRQTLDEVVKSELVSNVVERISSNDTPMTKQIEESKNEIIECKDNEVKQIEESKNEIIECKDNEVKQIEESKNEIIECKDNEVKKSKKEQKKAFIQIAKPVSQDAVTMQNRNPRLDELIKTLQSFNIDFTYPKKNPTTGLYELTIIYPNKSLQPINVDIDGLLYDDRFKFFVGSTNAGDEYIKPCYYLTVNNLLYNPEPISSELFELNQQLDLQTLNPKIKDPEKREAVFKRAATALEIMQIDIQNARGNEASHFAFARAEDENNFSLVSSGQNLASNLDSNSYLNVTKEIWINVKDKDVSMTTKKIKNKG